MPEMIKHPRQERVQLHRNEANAGKMPYLSKLKNPSKS